MSKGGIVRSRHRCRMGDWFGRNHHGHFCDSSYCFDKAIVFHGILFSEWKMLRLSSSTLGARSPRSPAWQPVA